MRANISKKVIVVIPAFNEAATINDVISSVRETGVENIIVVDDGSEDNTAALANQAGAKTLRHSINRGKGTALTTGLRAALFLEGEVIVTMDADGQHLASDLPSLIRPIINGEAKIVLGARKFSERMPATRRWGNHVVSATFRMMTGLRVSDTQSGFRAYTPAVARLVVNEIGGYEFETQTLQTVVQHRIRYKEVPITTVYTNYTKTKPQRQHAVNVLKTGYRLILRKIV